MVTPVDRNMAAADGGSTSFAPMISVAERVAALQKGKGGSNIHITKPKKDGALADRITAFQNNFEQSESESRSYSDSSTVKAKASLPIDNTADGDGRDGRTTDENKGGDDIVSSDTTTKSSSAFTNTDRPLIDPTLVKPSPNIISMASRVAALNKTIETESRSKSAHPIRNMKTPIQASIVPPFTMPVRVSVLQNTNAPQERNNPGRLSLCQSAALKLSMTRKTAAAADDVMKSRPPLNQSISTDLEVSVNDPKPKRQVPILKNVTNRTGNEIKAKKSADLPPKTSKLNQKAHYALASSKKKGKENTQAYKDKKSTDDVSDVDSDMVTVPTSNSNGKPALDSSFDTTWLESQITTPVTKTTSRKNNYDDDDDDDDFFINKRLCEDHDTDEIYEEEFNLNNGCFYFDEIKSAFALFIPNSLICSKMQK